MNNIHFLLKTLKISEKEYNLYSLLYKTGPASASKLSNVMQLPRTTVYESLKKLMNKGLVSQTFRERKRLFVGEPPSKVKTLLDVQKLQIQDSQRILSEAESHLPQFLNEFANQSPFGTTSPQSEIRYYEGKQAVDRVYDELLSSTEIKCYIHSSEMLHYFPENPQKCIKALTKGLKVWDIDIDSDPEIQAPFLNATKNLPNYHLKFFPENTLIHYMDYTIYEDCIATIQGGVIPTALVIKNKVLADNARAIYDLLWSFL